VGLLTAGGGERVTVGQSCTTPVDSIRLRAVSLVDRCGQQTLQAIQGTASWTNKTNKRCVAVAVKPAGIKEDTVAAVREEIRSMTARDQ